LSLRNRYAATLEHLCDDDGDDGSANDDLEDIENFDGFGRGFLRRGADGLCGELQLGSRRLERALRSMADDDADRDDRGEQDDVGDLVAASRAQESYGALVAAALAAHPTSAKEDEAELSASSGAPPLPPRRRMAVEYRLAHTRLLLAEQDRLAGQHQEEAPG
jgi:hypothetical protein